MTLSMTSQSAGWDARALHLSDNKVAGEDKARGAHDALQARGEHVRQPRHLVHKVVQQVRVARQEAHRVDQRLQNTIPLPEHLRTLQHIR